MTATTALYCGFQCAWAMLSQKWAVFEPKVEFSQQSICWNDFFHESWYFAIPECFLFEDLRTVCKLIQQHRNALEKIIILCLFSFFFFFTDEWTPWRELICVRSQKESMQLATLKKVRIPTPESRENARKWKMGQSPLIRSFVGLLQVQGVALVIHTRDDPKFLGGSNERETQQKANDGNYY